MRRHLSAMNPRTLALAAALAAVPAATGCVHSVEADVNVADAATEDREYAPALASATKERTVFKDFETRVRITATYLSPDFRGAFSRRLEKVYRKGQVEFEEAASKAGFFVSVHAPDLGRTDLSNPHHWTIMLDSKDGPVQPILVRKLDDKERWRAFFPAVTDWTTEYLVVFDAPSVVAHSPQLVEQTAVAVTFANADAQVTLNW